MQVLERSHNFSHIKESDIVREHRFLSYQSKYFSSLNVLECHVDVGLVLEALMPNHTEKLAVKAVLTS